MLPRVRIETAPAASVNSGVGCRRERWLSVTPAGISGVMPSKRIVTNVLLKVSVLAVIAAVVGVVLNLALWFSLHTLFGEVTNQNFSGLRFPVPQFATLNLMESSIALLAFLLTFVWKKGVGVTLGSSVAAGTLLFLAKSVGLF